MHRQRVATRESERSDGAELLTGPKGQRHIARMWPFCQPGASGEHGGHSGGIVVGAVVYLARLIFAGQRVAARAATKVVVVSAKHDPGTIYSVRRAGCGKITDHVVALAALAMNADAELGSHP